MTPEQLAAIKARADAATPGPWRWRNTTEPLLVGARTRIVMAFARMGMRGAQPQFVVDDRLVNAGRENLNGFPDAAFIAHAREDVPALLAEVERLTAASKAAQDDAYVCGRRDAETEVARLRAVVASVEALAHRWQRYDDRARKDAAAILRLTAAQDAPAPTPTEADRPPGCGCSCHAFPGVKHIVACCDRPPFPTEEDR